MAAWLLSGHNPQETFGTSYPISFSYIAEFTGRRQLEYIISPLAGGADQIDWSIPILIPVQGRLFFNVFCLTQNVALAAPFDPAAIGVPKELVTSQRKPRLSARLMLPFRFGNLYRQAMRTYRQVIPGYRKALDAIYWRLRACDPDQPTEEDLVQAGRLFEPAMVEQVGTFANVFTFVALLNLGLLGWVNRKAPGLLNLLVGRTTSTAQLGQRMWELGQVALQCGDGTVDLLRQGETDLNQYRRIPTAAPLLNALELFLRSYGHRAFHYASEFEATRLIDQPDLVLLAISGLLQESESPAARAAAAARTGEQALQRMNPLRRFFWKSLLRLSSQVIERREENRDTLELQTAVLGLAGRLLSRSYFPDQPPDYLWLYTFDEFLAFGKSHGQERVAPETIVRRRAELERNRQLPPPPELIWYDPETEQWWPVQEAEEGWDQPAEAPLQGIGVSSGKGPVEGIAMVTNSAKEAAERILRTTGPVVLVTHVTDPVWSSLFRRLTAVVTEMGGVVSHAAAVARENGIPAVVGMPGATRRIRDGQRVRVNGASGVVEVIG